MKTKHIKPKAMQILMPHWTKDADAAQRLADAVENNHGGRV
jgi:hypothetical protein